MKFNAIHIIIYTILLALLPACELIHDDLPDTKAEGAPVYIRLTISTGGEMGTKANPTGGEDGDGWQDGIESENAVNDVTLFFFPISVDIDGEATTTVTSLSFTKEDLTGPFNGTDRVDKYYTVTKEVEGLTEDDYNVLAVVNADKLLADITTLCDLRDHIIESSVSTPNNFMMSSERLATVEKIQGTSEHNPAHVDIYVERLAARVDYKLDASKLTDGKFTAEGGSVEILGASLVNDFKKGEYLFKRVGDAADASTYTYLGDETESSGVATNWVVDAYTTSEKQAENYTNYYPTYVPNISDDTDNTDWVRIGYTLENTNPSNADKEKYTTGVVFKAKFTPTDGAATDGSFYYLNGKFYKSLDDITGYGELTDENYEDYGISLYKEGICYYTWWIKHSNDNNDDTDGTMEYAIVRNNLYQLTVTSVSGLPLDGDEIVIRVAVADWEPMTGENITLEKQ